MKLCYPMRLIGLLAFAAGVHAQSLEATVGSSEVYGSSGLFAEYRMGETHGWTGIGYESGMRYGAFYSAPLKWLLPGWKNARLEVGDQPISAHLDVDEQDAHGFTVRGMSIVRSSERSRLQVFGGELTEQTVQPYLHFASTSGTDLKETPMGAVVYENKFSKTLQLHSLNLFTDKLTSIQSVRWKPSAPWRLDGAAGLGFGTPYLSAVSSFEKPWIALRTSYTAAGRSFHRQEGPYTSNEPLGMNARVQFSPVESFQFGLAHEHMLTYMSQPVGTGQSLSASPTVVSTFDSANLSAWWKGFRVGAMASTGKVENATGNTTTELVTVMRKFTRSWRSFGSTLNMRMPENKNRALIDINEFRVNPRLAIRQNYTRINGQNSFSFGGEWRSNLLSFSIDQTTYFSPLAASVGGKSMFQAWTFNVHLRGPRGTSANLDTFVDPMGRMQWGGYLGGLRYDAVAPVQNSSPSFSRYVVHGLVVDEAGKGVWGIALTIGKDTVISDEKGEFFLRVKNAAALPLRVDPDLSMQARRWQLETAPKMVKGALENEQGEKVQVVVQTGNFVAKN